MTAASVAVLCGGNSSEREISLRSGRAVHKALSGAGARCELIDVRDADYLERLKKGRFDVAFVAMHGKFGEDGELQKILEREGIRYTGSGPEACRLAMDKAESRRLFAAAGLKIPHGIVIDTPLDPRIQLVRFPIFAKPVTGGSSIGVACAKKSSELESVLGRAFREDSRVIVEERIKGREMTVGILGGKALPPIEIIPARDFYDYEAKYSDAGTRYEDPAGISVFQTLELKRAALRAHRTLGCSGFSRVDFILAGDGAYILEVNAIPGLTERSLLPKMAAKIGLSFAELCDRIIQASFDAKTKESVVRRG